MPERAAEATLSIPFPVASAIKLPTFLALSKLSIRSGILFRAKEPAWTIMRGMTKNKSLGDGFENQVAFDVEEKRPPWLVLSKGVGINGGLLADMSLVRLEILESVEDMEMSALMKYRE